MSNRAKTTIREEFLFHSDEFLLCTVSASILLNVATLQTQETLSFALEAEEENQICSTLFFSFTGTLLDLNWSSNAQVCRSIVYQAPFFRS